MFAPLRDPLLHAVFDSILCRAREGIVYTERKEGINLPPNLFLPCRSSVLLQAEGNQSSLSAIADFSVRPQDEGSRFKPVRGLHLLELFLVFYASLDKGSFTSCLCIL